MTLLGIYLDTAQRGEVAIAPGTEKRCPVMHVGITCASRLCCSRGTSCFAFAVSFQLLAFVAAALLLIRLHTM